MKIEVRGYNERILLAFTEDGELKEAAVYRIEQVYKDGATFGNPKYADPVPVDVADLEKALPDRAKMIADLYATQVRLGTAESEVITMGMAVAESASAVAAVTETLERERTEFAAIRGELMKRIASLTK